MITRLILLNDKKQRYIIVIDNDDPYSIKCGICSLRAKNNWHLVDVEVVSKKYQFDDEGVPRGCEG